MLLIRNDPSGSGFMLDPRKRKGNYVLSGAGEIMLAVGDTRWLKVHNESI